MNSKLTAALAVILAAIMVVPCAAVCTSSAGETGVPDAVGSDYIDDGDISVGGTFDSVSNSVSICRLSRPSGA